MPKRAFTYAGNATEDNGAFLFTHFCSHVRIIGVMFLLVKCLSSKVSPGSIICTRSEGLEDGDWSDTQGRIIKGFPNTVNFSLLIYSSSTLEDIESALPPQK